MKTKKMAHGGASAMPEAAMERRGGGRRFGPDRDSDGDDGMRNGGRGMGRGIQPLPVRPDMPRVAQPTVINKPPIPVMAAQPPGMPTVQGGMSMGNPLAGQPVMQQQALPPAPMGGMAGMGAVRAFKKGGAVKAAPVKTATKSSASRRGDGIAQRGKTKGRMV